MTLSFNEIPVPAHIADKVVATIERIQEARRRRGAFFGIMAGAMSFAGMVALFLTIVHTLKSSGTFSYGSLLFSGGLKYWKEISLAVFDSLPVWGIAAFLATCLTFGVSAFQVLKNSRGTFIKHKHIVWN